MSLSVAGCGDAVLRAVEDHPLAEPTLVGGEVTAQGAWTGDRGTGLGPSNLYTFALTRYKVPAEDIDQSVEELRSQAEALGYEFESIRESRLHATQVPEYPGIEIEIVSTDAWVSLSVVGLRDD